MKEEGYLKRLIKSNTGDSSKSFALVVSTLMGVFIGFIVCFILIWDVITNGTITVDLEKLGLFLLCSGGYLFSGGAIKMFTDIYETKKGIKTNTTEETKSEN